MPPPWRARPGGRDYKEARLDTGRGAPPGRPGVASADSSFMRGEGAAPRPAFVADNPAGTRECAGRRRRFFASLLFNLDAPTVRAQLRRSSSGDLAAALAAGRL